MMNASVFRYIHPGLRKFKGTKSGIVDNHFGQCSNFLCG